jgi:hypothetical protein
MSLYDLTGNKVSFTYGRLVQIASGSYYDGFGNLLNLSGTGSGTILTTGSTYPITSSWAIHSINVDGGYVTASGILTAGDIIPSNPSASLGTVEFPFKDINISSGSISLANADPLIEAVVLSNVNGNLDVSSGGIRLVQENSSFIAPTGSFSYLSSSFKQVGDRLLIGNDIISGSLQVVNGITGSLYGTSSWSNNSISSSVSISSSYTVNASYSSNSLTASYFGSGSDNYFPFWSSNKLSYNSLISQSNNQIAILSDTASFLGNALIINKSDPIYVNNNPTIDASNSPNQTLMLTPNVVIGGDGNSEHWNRFNSDGTVDFLGANIKFTSGGAAAFNSSITIGSPVLLGNNKLDVIGNISASAITASRLVGTADSASYLTPTNNYTVSNLTSSNILVTGTIYASNFSASTIYITSSEYIVSDNIITLNALNPYRRYAGLELHDSGSSNFSSILWDSQNNYLFVSSSETVGSRQIILGPDNEVNLISNYIPLISSSNTITSSIIYQNTGNIGIGTTSPSAKVDVVGDIQANAFYGKSFNLTTTSGQSAIFDTFTSTGTGEVYEVIIKSNPNAGESGNYQDVIYGKIIVGTGKTGSIVTTFINYVQESPDPRLLYSSGGSSLTASVYFNSSSVDVTQKGVGQSTPIRVVIGSYAVGYVGNNTTVRLKQIL